jgi:PadR family transcriptional regulator, regulatory protein AphA
MLLLTYVIDVKMLVVFGGIMSIEYVILGLLSWRSLTGYDLKKIFMDSVMLYWSGNNNEIYKALVSLHKENLVNREIQQQENYPARKVYSITEKGVSELKKWVLSTPELPHYKPSFLIQLSWADALTSDELDALLADYEEEVLMQLLMCRVESQQQDEKSPQKNQSAFLNTLRARTPREAFLWGMIQKNWLSFYENELRWVRQLRQELLTANYTIKEE